MGERRQLRRLAAVWLLLLAALACHARPQDAATAKPEADNIITSGALPTTTMVAPKDAQLEKEVARDVSNSGALLPGTRRWSPRRGAASPALGPSIASVAGQLLEDTRTPPLVQQLRAQAQADLRHEDQASGSGSGEAVPVLLEEHELADERRVQQLLDRTRGGGAAAAGTTRPQPGISTWVLLSGSNSSPNPEEPSSTTPTTTTTAAPGKNKKNGASSAKPAASSTTTTAPPPHKAGGGKKPAAGGGLTPRPPPSTASNNKFVHQFRPLLHSRPANPAKLAAAATATSTASPQSSTTTSKTTTPTTTTSTTTAAASSTKKPPKTTTTTTTVPPPAKANRPVEPEEVQLLPALTRQPPSKAKPSPAAPTAAIFRRRPASNNTTAASSTTSTSSGTTTAAPQATSTTAQPPSKATTSKVKTTTTTTPSSSSTTTPVSIVATSAHEEAAEDATETSPEETTTKRQRRPGNPSSGGRERKKNKNKRRKRPTAQQDQQPAESKVTELSPELKAPGNASRPAGNKEKRPLSTRIYNYLAREVMPSVGVGLIGLVVTAGLAGLMLYPFGGGVAARRTYEEEEAAQRLRYGPGPPNQGGFLYYEGAGPDGKPEEAVLREVFEGMAPVDEPVSSYHQPQANDDSDATYSYSPGSVASGYSGHHYSGSYGAMASSTTPPSAGQPGPYYSGHADSSTGGEYRRPQYHQRLEATPKHAATAASPVSSAGPVSPEKFYGSEAVHVRTADMPKYSSAESSQTLSAERQRQQEKAIGYSVVAAGDRVGTVEVAYGGRVRHHQVGEASSAIAEHGPRSLDAGADMVTTQTTEATHIETRKRRDVAEDEMVRPDSLLLDNDIDVVWAKEKKWPPKKEVGSSKQPIKWTKDSSLVQDVKTSTTEVPTSTIKTNILPEKSTMLPVTTESASVPSEGDEEMSSSTRVSVVDMGSETTTDGAHMLEDTSGEPAVVVTEVLSVTEETRTVMPLNSSEDVLHPGTPAVEDFFTNFTDDSSAPSQQNQMSFTDVLRRIAHFKMRLGLSLLKSTSEAFSRYLGTVQKRMEETLAEAGRARYQTGPGEGSAGVAFWNAVRRAQRGLFDRQRRRDQ